MQETLMHLIRHGATPNNLADPPVLQGCSVDAPLSETGFLQAAAAAAVLRTWPIQAVYSSPLLRAVQTAEVIAAPHALSVTTNPALREIHVGRWEGRSWVHIAEEEPEAYQRFQTDPATYGYAGGENLREVLARSAPAFEAMLQRHSGQVIVVVAHNVVNRAYLSHLLHIPLSQARLLSQNNGAINTIRYHQGNTTVETLNARFHLPEFGGSDCGAAESSGNQGRSI